MAFEAELRALYTAAGQGHVFAFWDACDEAERAALLEQLRQVDPHEINKIFRSLPAAGDDAAPPAVTPVSAHASVGRASDAERAAWEAEGLQAVARGEVALLLLAGGQGTRLGSADPKGMFDIGLPSGKSLFQLQAERISALRRLAASRCGLSALPALPWYIMTSAATRAKTEAFFEAHGYFGLPRADVSFFDQGWLPCLAPADGAMLLAARGELAAAPDGNGGVFRALRVSGRLADMRRRGVASVHAYCVDNALVAVGDPQLVGFCRLRRCATGAKVVPRAFATEAVGVFAADVASAALRVVEYSELPPALAAARVGPPGDPAAELAFNAANVALHYFALPFLERCAAADVALPYHAALKKVPCLPRGADAAAQSAAAAAVPAPPASPNALKLEAFIFDVYPLAAPADVALLEGVRGDDFAPVKNANAEGARDTPASAAAALCARHRRWAAAAGATVRGEGLFELSPALSYGGEGLEGLAGRSFDTPCHVDAL